MPWAQPEEEQITTSTSSRSMPLNAAGNNGKARRGSVRKAGTRSSQVVSIAMSRNSGNVRSASYTLVTSRAFGNILMSESTTLSAPPR